MKAIEKWDGKLPNVTGGAVPFIQVEKEKWSRRNLPCPPRFRGDRLGERAGVRGALSGQK